MIFVVEGISSAMKINRMFVYIIYYEIRLDRDKGIELKISPEIDNNHIWHWDTNYAAVSFNSSLLMSMLSI